MEIKGIITAMITPFDENQNIDYEAACKLANKLIEDGVDGLFILGTNGEFHRLNAEEKVAFAKAVIAETGHRIPVYVGTGGNSTREVITLSKQMEAIGADALSIITPFFIPPTQLELIKFYQDIASETAIPIVLYNMPGRTGINIEPETLKVLANVDNIAGIKDSSGKLDNMKAYIESTKNAQFSVLSGSDSLILEALKAGGAGAVSATSNLLTPIIVDIYQQWRSGDLQAAGRSQAAVEDLRSVLKLGTIPSVLKKAMDLAGIPAGPARFPVMPPTGEAVDKIKQVVEKYQIKY